MSNTYVLHYRKQAIEDQQLGLHGIEVGLPVRVFLSTVTARSSEGFASREATGATHPRGANSMVY